jgi:acyl-CoA thioester hydrolase
MPDVRLPDFATIVPVEVRFRDLDAMGHVNNAVFFTYFEQARTRYWLSLTGASASDVRSIGFIVVHGECDYVSPATLGETLLVGVRIPAAGKSSFSFEYRIVAFDAKQDAPARLVATGKTVQALYDWEAKATVPLTDELRRKIEAREGKPLRTLSR